MKTKVILRFKEARHKPSAIDGIDIRYFYDIVTILKEGRKKPVEKASSFMVRVLISGSLAADWGFAIWRPSEEYQELSQLLLPYAVEHVKKCFYSGKLNQQEEVRLIHGPSQPEYDIDEYGPIDRYEEVLEETEKSKTEPDKATSSVANEIITLRDHINTLVYTKIKKGLLDTDQEQNLGELHKMPNKGGVLVRNGLFSQSGWQNK